MVCSSSKSKVFESTIKFFKPNDRLKKNFSLTLSFDLESLHFEIRTWKGLCPKGLFINSFQGHSSSQNQWFLTVILESNKKWITYLFKFLLYWWYIYFPHCWLKQPLAIALSRQKFCRNSSLCAAIYRTVIGKLVDSRARSFLSSCRLSDGLTNEPTWRGKREAGVPRRLSKIALPERRSAAQTLLLFLLVSWVIA